MRYGIPTVTPAHFGVNLLSVAVVLIILGPSSLPASAQILNAARLQSHEHQVYVDAGLSPALVTTVGYAHALRPGGRAVGLSAELAMGLAGGDLGDYRARLGMETAVLRRGNGVLSLRARGVVEGTRNDIYDAVGLGMDFTGFAGVYRPSWLLAVEGTFGKTLATHIENSAWYRENFYSGAKDGWYGDSAGIWYLGLASQRSFGRMDLSLRLGKRWSQGGHVLDPPVVATIGLGRRF